MIHPYARKYLIAGLNAMPDTMDTILKNVGPESSVWDVRPDPERFTIREVLAHLADWEPIWLSRMQRIVEEDKPVLENIDEEQMAIDHDYAHQDPRANLLSFRKDRKMLVNFLQSLPDEAWERVGIRPPAIGEMSLFTLAALILGHDGYHIHQIIQWSADADRAE